MVSIRKNNSFGFTLIELLVVIAVVGVLAGAVIVMINPGTQLARARDAKRKGDVAQIRKALENYLVLNGQYPTSNWVNSTQGGSWIPGLVSGGEIKLVPQDPKNVQTGDLPWSSATNYAYYYLSNDYYNGAGGGPICGATPANSYYITVHLESSSDPFAGNTYTVGNGAPGCTYGLAGWYTVGPNTP